MEDREMLERAAKAAGFVVNAARQAERDADGAGNVGLWLDGVSTCWNPITDDGDALRLAVKLRITPDQGWKTRVIAESPTYTTSVNCSDDNRAEATRRAITRAAAAIGKEMP